jgi:hypothetical protein
MFILNSLSRHSYYLKMMKHLFYIKLNKLNKEDGNIMTILKKQDEPDSRGWIKSHDRFSTHNLKLNKLFESKCPSFKEPDSALSPKLQNQKDLLTSEISFHYRLDFKEVTKWLWLRMTWLSDFENIMFNKGVRKCKEEVNMISLVRSVRQFESLLNIWGIDENKKLLLERNKMNQLIFKPSQLPISSPRYVKEKKGIQF